VGEGEMEQKTKRILAEVKGESRGSGKEESKENFK